MITRNFVFFLLIISPNIALSQQVKADSGKIIIQEVQSEEIEEEVPPPPPDLKSNFKSLNDWLNNICDHEKPKKSIEEYNFGLFEAPNEYILFLVGVNKYNEGTNRSRTSIEFKPTKMYFKLPQKEYANLSREMLLDKLTNQLKDLTGTKKFNTSFLAKAKTITFESNGQKIWSRD